MVREVLVLPVAPRPQTPDEERREAEQLRELQLLLENLFQREEVTARLVLSHLYDMGAINWVNQKAAHPLLNRPLKKTAKLVKPLVQPLALQWFQQNCPRLIVNWLHDQVTFAPPPPPTVDVSAESSVATALTAGETVPALPPAQMAVELDRLRRQVRRFQRLTTGLALLLVVSLGGSLWLMDRSQSSMADAPAASTPVQP